MKPVQGASNTAAATTSSVGSHPFMIILVAIWLFMQSAFYLPGVITSASANSGFEPWDEQVFIAVAERYGPAAAERLRKVHDLILENHDKPVSEKLMLVNDFLNNIPWIADHVLWNKNDYWATLFETLTNYGGDCEDLAIAKYQVLRMMGVTDEKLGLAYVLTSNDVRHMVLLYLDSPAADPLILDNEIHDVLPFAKRSDIVGIYLFQNDGTLYLFEADGRHTGKFKARYEHTKLSKWNLAMEREKKNIELYAQYNRGKPLLPK